MDERGLGNFSLERGGVRRGDISKNSGWQWKDRIFDFSFNNGFNGGVNQMFSLAWPLLNTFIACSDIRHFEYQ